MVWHRIDEAQGALDELCRRHRVRELALFGSAASAQFDPDHSDLDFVVEFEEMPPAEYAEAYFELWEGLQALFGKRVDLVTTASLRNPYFRRQVEKSRVALYAA